MNYKGDFMAYEKHPLFTDPEEPDVKLWRYMDFTKLVSLLQKRALFFPSARTLQKIDPWEGEYSKKQLDNIRDYERYRLEREGKTVTYEKIKDWTDGWEKRKQVDIDNSYISCWHYNSIESAAMWGLYLKSNEGVAIRTDIGSFKDSFKNYSYNVNIGVARYINYETDIFSNTFSLSDPFIHKRKIYEHEKEYRAIIRDDIQNFKDEKQNGGIFVPVDLKLLIKKIILAPDSPEWFKELVEDTLKTYKLDVKVVRSVVDDEPYKFDLEPYKD
jgi:hypothetical protein